MAAATDVLGSARNSQVVATLKPGNFWSLLARAGGGGGGGESERLALTLLCVTRQLAPVISLVDQPLLAGW